MGKIAKTCLAGLVGVALLAPAPAEAGLFRRRSGELRRPVRTVLRAVFARGCGSEYGRGDYGGGCSSCR